MSEACETLLARLEVLTWRLLQGEDNDPARLLATLTRLMELAPSMRAEQRTRLMARLDQASAAVQAAQQRLASKIESLPQERRAMRGYVRHNSARPVTGRVSRHI